MVDENTPIEKIRAMVSPEMQVAQLEQAKAHFEQRIAGTLVDYDTLRDNPEVDEEKRAAEKAQLEKVVRDLGYRLTVVLQQLDEARGKLGSKPRIYTPS